MSKRSPGFAQSNPMLRILANAKVTVFAQDLALQYRWIENLPSSWGGGDASGKTDTDLLPAKAAAQAVALRREVLHAGAARWGELVVEYHSETSYFDVFLEPERDAAGEIVGICGLAIDVSDRRKQEATIDSVARNISHRTKNLLAVIQSLGTQTARASESTDDFIEQFRGRIQSISRSQDLSIGARKYGASLNSLIELQTHPYVDGGPRRIQFRGADRYLTPNGALHIGLGLYELGIHSAQFGALSVPNGKVMVTAELHGNPNSTEAGKLKITWREEGGPPPRKMDGFSRTFLERIVPASVGGAATIMEDDRGMLYELFVSDSEFD